MNDTAFNLPAAAWFRLGDTGIGSSPVLFSSGGGGRFLFIQTTMSENYRNTSPAFQFYPKEWLSSAKVNLMTPAQEGAYFRLLAYAWLDPNCSIPDDDAELAALSRLNEGWFNGGSSVVRKCFVSHPTISGRLVNLRLLEERKKQQVWREKSREGGIRSAVTRSNKKRRVVRFGSKKNEPNVNQTPTLQFPVSSLQSADIHSRVDSKDGEMYHRDSRTVLHLLNELTGRHFRELEHSLGPISARLQEPGVTLDGVRLMLKRQSQQWKGTHMEEFLRPSTLFRPGNFNEYYAAKDLPIPNHHGNANGKTHQRVTTENPRNIGTCTGNTDYVEAAKRASERLARQVAEANNQRASGAAPA